MGNVRAGYGKRPAGLLFVLCVLFLLAGCTSETKEPQKQRDLEFTVVPPENLPEELSDIIEERKTDPFKITYEDEGWLYVAVGYGKQKGGGFSIQAAEFYETENAIYVATTLLGSKDSEGDAISASYQYIVLKTEAIGKNVVFRS